MESSDLAKDNFYLLDNLSAIRVAGDDAEEFLQGQLSNDVGLIRPATAQFSSVNSPQGRVIAILRVTQNAGGFQLILPKWQTESVVQGLSRYILRSRVVISVEPDFKAIGISRDKLAPLEEGMEEAVQQLALPGDLQECYGTPSAIDRLCKQLKLSPVSGVKPWQAKRISAGVPEIAPDTAEKFVAQMLNLDCLGGISFNKGCFTGQEIIARTQHRGQIKRRTFIGRSDVKLSGRVRLIDKNGSKRGDVLEVSTFNDTVALLAVVNIDAANEKLFAGDVNGPVVMFTPPAYLREDA